MEKLILIINWLVFGGLFFSFFLKISDKKERSKCRRITYTLLMLWSLFMSVFLFKLVFIYEEIKINENLSLFETIFNALVLLLMVTKVKDDKAFDVLKRKRYGSR